MREDRRKGERDRGRERGGDSGTRWLSLTNAIWSSVWLSSVHSSRIRLFVRSGPPRERRSEKQSAWLR